MLKYNYMKKLVTIMIPAYNEEKSLPKLFKRLNLLAKNTSKYDFEFLFINDGSKDKTMEIIRNESEKDSRVSYINLSRNFGKENAMLAGFDYAKGDALVIIDADLQDPPELIPAMLSLWEEGYDDVYAKRESRDGETWLKKQTSKWFYSILDNISKIEIQRDTGDFRLLDRRTIEALKTLRENNRYTKGMFSWVGFKKKKITYKRDARIAGETKWNYPKLFNLAVEGITSFTVAPLRIATITGFFISIGAFLWIAFLLIRPLFGVPTGDGYASIMSVILFLGGIQLISIGILGEYIGRIFIESKNRPVSTMKNLLKKLKNSQEFWFVVVGGLNTILDFVILFSLTAFNVPIIIANIFSTGITFANSFSLNKKITFKSISKNKKELVREITLFIIITLFGLWAIQNFIIFILSPIFENIFKNNKIALLISKLIATIFSLIWNFILYKKVVFKK